MGKRLTCYTVDLSADFCEKSRHTVVCRVAQENGAHANGVSILTGTTKSQFSCICSSVMYYPNGT